MSKFNQLSGAIRFALFAGAATLMASPAFAQEEKQDEAATLDRIEVTGSRIKRADIEGALPVTVISRQQIENSGEVSVSDFLRNSTFNSFGSVRPASGSSTGQAEAGLSLRGLGSGRTLILVDGRRAPIAAGSGSFQDLTSIPMAAVERIEILSDGASAIYGSDAIGGVVNIITRKDFNGAEFSYGAGYPRREGGDTETASIIFGASSDRARVLAGASLDEREIVWQRDRDWSSGGVSTFSNNFRTASTFLRHPTNGSIVPGGCSDPGFTEAPAGVNGRCFYDFTFVAADEAQTKNTAVFMRSDYQINDDWLAYFNASVSRVTSFGRYAPVPSSPWIDVRGIPLLPTSPNHPANRFPTDPFYAGLAGQTVYLRHRFAALGNRDNDQTSNVYDFNAGFQGRIGSVDLDFGTRYSEFKMINLGRNYVVATLAQQYIDSGAYDIYDPSGNPRSVMDGMIATTSVDSTSILKEAYAVANFDLFEMAGGTSSMAVGAEYREETWNQIFDSLSASGSVSGSSGNSGFGARDVTALYFEALFPFMSNFEMSLAGRFDDYSDYGNDFAPKIAFRYQPMDTLTLRASYGQGFRAPTLDIVGQQPAFGADSVTDAQTCAAFGQPPACSTQVTSYTIANPNVESEQSKQYSVGMAWDAADWLNLTLDYYNIKLENRSAFIDTQAIIECLAGTRVSCPSGLSSFSAGATPPTPSLGLGVQRDPTTGEIIFSQIGYVNLGTIQTSGLDFVARTNFDLGGMGSLRNQFQVGYVRDFDVDGSGNGVGLPGQPKYRAGLQNVWEKGDFSVSWNISYIHGFQSTQGRNIELCAADPDCDVADVDYGYATHIPSHTMHDVQLAWKAPWNARVMVGVDNLTDKDPNLDPLTLRGFDVTLYDPYGRTPYFRYTQSF